MGKIKKILTNLGQLDPCLILDEATYQLVEHVYWIVPSLRNVTLRLGRSHRAKKYCGIIGKRMRVSRASENIIPTSKPYGLNQIQGTHLSFAIENFYIWFLSANV